MTSLEINDLRKSVWIIMGSLHCHASSCILLAKYKSYRILKHFICNEVAYHHFRIFYIYCMTVRGIDSIIHLRKCNSLGGQRPKIHAINCLFYWIYNRILHFSILCLNLLTFDCDITMLLEGKCRWGPAEGTQISFIWPIKPIKLVLSENLKNVISVFNISHSHRM